MISFFIYWPPSLYILGSSLIYEIVNYGKHNIILIKNLKQ